MRSRFKRAIVSNFLLLMLSGLGLVLLSFIPEKDVNSSPLKDETIHITVGIPPVAYLVDRIGGSHVAVTTLITPGTSPHQYNPLPREIAELSETSIYFGVGEPFEDQVLKKIRTSVAALTVVNLELPQNQMQYADSTAAGAPDPHIWMTPVWAIAAADSIGNALCTYDTAHASEYRERLGVLEHELHQLDVEIATILQPYAGRRIYVYHDAFGYFCKRYYVRQVAIEEEGKEPSPHRLAEVAQMARADNVSIVFAQPQYSIKTVQTVAAEIGARPALLDPLAFNYIENLRYIAKQIVASFTERTAQ